MSPLARDPPAWTARPHQHPLPALAALDLAGGKPAVFSKVARAYFAQIRYVSPMNGGSVGISGSVTTWLCGRVCE